LDEAIEMLSWGDPDPVEASHQAILAHLHLLQARLMVQEDDPNGEIVMELLKGIALLQGLVHRPGVEMSIITQYADYLQESASLIGTCLPLQGTAWSKEILHHLHRHHECVMAEVPRKSLCLRMDALNALMHERASQDREFLWTETRRLAHDLATVGRDGQVDQEDLRALCVDNTLAQVRLSLWDYDLPAAKAGLVRAQSQWHPAMFLARYLAEKLARLWLQDFGGMDVGQVVLGLLSQVPDAQDHLTDRLLELAQEAHAMVKMPRPLTPST
jgi:hypothetical protein